MNFFIQNNFSLTSSDANFYEDDDEDEDNLGEEDIAVEEERMTRRIHLDRSEEQAENDDIPSSDTEELTGDSTIKDGKIIPNEKLNDSAMLKISLKYFLFMISFNCILWYILFVFVAELYIWIDNYTLI